MRSGFVVALLMTVALAGCTDEAGGNETVEDPAGDGMAEKTLPGLTQIQAIAASAEVITFSEEGSFTGADTFCAPTCKYDEFSITPHMDENTAYFLEVELRSDTNSGGYRIAYMQGLEAYSADGGNAWEILSVRDYDGVDTSGDNPRLTATLLAPNDNLVSLRVGANGVVAGEGGDYEVDFTLTPIPDMVPQYAAVALQVPAGAEVIAESQNGEGRVAVFDGQDQLVDVVEITSSRNISGQQIMDAVVLTNVTAAQEYVFFALDDIWTKYYINQVEETPVQLRHLPMRLERTDFGTLNDEQATLTHTAEIPPLKVGYRYGNNCGREAGDCYASSGLDGSMTGPGGDVLFKFTSSCELCGGFQSDITDWDAGPLLAGDYVLDWQTSGDTNNVLIETRAIHYDR